MCTIYCIEELLWWCKVVGHNELSVLSHRRLNVVVTQHGPRPQEQYTKLPGTSESHRYMIYMWAAVLLLLKSITIAI